MKPKIENQLHSLEVAGRTVLVTLQHVEGGRWWIQSIKAGSLPPWQPADDSFDGPQEALAWAQSWAQSHGPGAGA